MDSGLIQNTIGKLKELKSERNELQEKVAELEDQLEHLQRAQHTAFKLYKYGGIDVDELESKIEEFTEEKTDHDLEVLEKAAELSVEGSGHSEIGSLSERPQDDGTTDPLTAYLLEDY